MNISVATTPRSANDYLRTIAAMTVVLELIMRKMKEIRDSDGRSHHVAALGHIRTALDYERKVLHELMDPKGMASITSTAMQELIKMPISDVLALLEEPKCDPRAPSIP